MSAPRYTPEQKAMISSGIGRDYVERSLTDYLPQSQKVIDLVKSDDFRDRLREGHGITIRAPGAFADNMVHMVSRSIIGRGINVCLIDLCDLERVMIEERGRPAELDRVERAAVIAIPSFTILGRQANPFTGLALYRIERLLHTFLDEKRALVLGGSGHFAPWWDEGLTERLNDINTVLELPGRSVR